MIKSIVIEGFKSLEKVELQLGNLNLFIGTNASGKSNFFEALRVLQGIGYGYRIDEILNGKPKSANSDVWDGIRGGGKSAAFRNDDRVSDCIRLAILFGEDEKKYTVAISPTDYRVTEEFFSQKLKGEYLKIFYAFSSTRGSLHNGKIGGQGLEIHHFVEGVTNPLVGNQSLPAPRQFLDYLQYSSRIGLTYQQIIALLDELSNVQHLDLQVQWLRNYSTSLTAERIGERGENFAGLVRKLLSKPETADAYLSWLKELSPDTIDAVEILHGAVGEPMFAIKSGNTVQPAPLLSDGTLRFAALTAALLQPDMPQRLLLEEIETGIHPSRLRLLVELLENRSKDVQIFATTHSPYVLAWLDQSHYEHTFIFKRDEETGATKVVPLIKVPHLMELLEKKQPLSDLFAEGWLESVL